MFDTVVAIELETTGPDPYRHEILELAGAIYADGEISARFSELVRPAGPVPVAVRKAAGLRAATRGPSSDARDPGAVLADFLDFLPEGATCISHHARRVRGFLRRATRDQFRRPVLDTEELARIGLPDLPEHTLEGLRDLSLIHI